MDKQINYTTLIEHIEYKIEDYQAELITKLVNKGICIVKGDKIKFIATGIIIYKNKFIIVFPKTYVLPTQEGSMLEHIKVLFEVLLKYRREGNVSSEEIELLGGKMGQSKEGLFTAYRLIKDFTINGLLLKEIGINSTFQSGRTDWQATINKKQPIFSGRSVIYSETISSKTTIDRQNQLYIIHKYCVYKSVEKYGWLLGLTVENTNIEKVELGFDVPHAVNFLINELNSTFVEREISVIKMLKVFLIGIEEKNNEDKLETLITPYFQNIWEYIRSYNFNNQYSALKGIIPKLNWEIESNAVVQNQRPDIIVFNNQKLYILDAKYYNTDNNLPGWPDVVKQLFYAQTIYKNIKSAGFRLPNKRLSNTLKSLKKVENIFLFPSGDVHPIKYIGKVNVENNNEFDDIKAYKINTYLAMKCFIGKQKYNYISQLSEI